MLNPMNYVAGAPDLVRGLVRSAGTTIGGVAQAVPEAGAFLSEGAGGAEAVTKLKLAKLLRGVGAGDAADRLESDAMAVLDNTFAASRGMRQEGQGAADWGRQVSLGARNDPSLQYSPQAQQGLDSMQRGESWLPTTAQGLMAMGGESGVPTAAAIAGGVVAGPAGAIGAGGLAALGSSYDQSMEELLNDPKWSTRPVNEVKAEAARRAIQSGIVEGGTGAIPVDEMLAGPIAKRFLSPTSGRVRSGAVRGATGMAEEAVQGGTAEAMGAVGDSISGDEDAFNDLPLRVLKAGVAEGVMGLGPGAAGGFASPGGVVEGGDGADHAVRDQGWAGQARLRDNRAANPGDADDVAGAVRGVDERLREVGEGREAAAADEATDAEVIAELSEFDGDADVEDIADEVLSDGGAAPEAETSTEPENGVAAAEVEEDDWEGWRALARELGIDDTGAGVIVRQRVREHESTVSATPATAVPPEEDAVADADDEEATQAEEGAEQAASVEGTGEPHDHSSTQLQLPPLVAGRVRQAAAAIDEADLAEDGREADPHITVKYGLDTDDAARVAEVLADQPPIEVSLGKTSLFENDDADVVKVDVDSPALHALNKKIADAIEHTDTHPDYKPHVTLAYVKPGAGKKYAGDAALAGQTVTLDRLVFSDRDGKKTEFKLGGTPTPAAQATAPTSPAATPDASGSVGTGASQTKPTRAGKRPSPRPASPGVVGGSTSEDAIEPWQRTRAEYLDAGRGDANFDEERWSDAHERAVEGALRRGQNVPVRVRADYIDMSNRIIAEQADTTDYGASIKKARPATSPRRRGAIAFPSKDDATKRADTVATMERRAAKQSAEKLASEQIAHDRTKKSAAEKRSEAVTEIRSLKGRLRAENTARKATQKALVNTATRADQTETRLRTALSEAQGTEMVRREQAKEARKKDKAFRYALDRTRDLLARTAVRADQREQYLQETITDLKERAEFKDTIAKRRSEAQTILLRSMSSILPRSEWGEYTRRVADVKTPGQAYVLAADMERRAVIMEAEELAKRAARLTGVKDVRDFADPAARDRAVTKGRMKFLASKMEGEPGERGSEKDAARKTLRDFAELGAKFDELVENAADIREIQRVVDALEATYQQVAMALHQRRTENKLIKKNGVQAAQLSRDIMEAAIRKRPSLKQDDRGNRERSVFGRIERAQMDAENMLLLLDDAKMTHTGEATRIFQEVRDGRAAASARAERLMSKVEAIARDAGFDGWGDARRQISGSLGESSQQMVTLPHAIGGRTKIPLSEALYLYGIDQRTQQNAIQKGRGFSWDNDRTKQWNLVWQDYDTIKQSIPENLRTMFDRMKLVVDENRPEMMETLRMLKGVEPPSEPGYLRTKANPEFYRPTEEVPRGYDADTVTYLENMGLTIGREPIAGVPLLVMDGLDAIDSSIADSSRIIELAMPLRNARAILASQGVRAAVAEHIGEDVNKNVDDLLVHAAGNKQPPDGWWDRKVRRLISNVARGKTQINHRAWLKNLGGIIKATGEVESSVVSRGLARMPGAILQKPGDFAKVLPQEMLDASPYLRERYTSSPVAILTGIQQQGVKYTTGTVMDAAGESIKKGRIDDVLFKQAPALLDHVRVSLWCDAMAARILWEGFSASGNGDAWTAEQVERVMRRTQNSADPMDVSAFALRNRDKAWGAAFLSFTSDANRSFNMLARARRQGLPQMRRAALAVALNSAWSAAVTTGFGTAGVAWVTGAFRGDDEEKQAERREEVMLSAARAYLTELAGITLFGDDIADIVWGWADGKPTQDRALTPVGGVLDALRRGVDQAVTGLNRLRRAPDPEAEQKAYDRLLDAALDLTKAGSSALGLPFEPAIGTYQTLKKAASPPIEDSIREKKRKATGQTETDVTDARKRLYDGLASDDDDQLERAFDELADAGVRLTRQQIESMVEGRNPYRGMSLGERMQYLETLTDKEREHETERFDRYLEAKRNIHKALNAQGR